MSCSSEIGQGLWNEIQLTWVQVLHCLEKENFSYLHAWPRCHKGKISSIPKCRITPLGVLLDLGLECVGNNWSFEYALQLIQFPWMVFYLLGYFLLIWFSFSGKGLPWSVSRDYCSSQQPPQLLPRQQGHMLVWYYSLCPQFFRILTLSATSPRYKAFW